MILLLTEWINVLSKKNLNATVRNPNNYVRNYKVFMQEKCKWSWAFLTYKVEESWNLIQRIMWENENFQ